MSRVKKTNYAEYDEHCQETLRIDVKGHCQVKSSTDIPGEFKGHILMLYEECSGRCRKHKEWILCLFGVDDILLANSWRMSPVLWRRKSIVRRHTEMKTKLVIER